MFESALFTSIGVYVLLLKLDIRKVVNWDIYIDIIVTLALAWLFKGTYIGVMTAMLAGLMLSGMLTFSKNFFGVCIWRGFQIGFDKEATNVSGW